MANSVSRSRLVTTSPTRSSISCNKLVKPNPGQRTQTQRRHLTTSIQTPSGADATQPTPTTPPTDALTAHHAMTVDEIADLDLSYTPPLGSPWDAVQMATQDWTLAHTTPTATRQTACRRGAPCTPRGRRWRPSGRGCAWAEVVASGVR